MKRLALALSVAALATLGAVATAAAADPSPAPTAAPVTGGANVNRGVMIPAILKLTHEEVMTLRQQGLTLAQIAERQGVDPQVLIDAFAGQWTVRIDERLALGAITADQAAALKADVGVRAKAMVNQVPLGGIGGQAVGGGRGQGGASRGQGAGIGIHAPGTGGFAGQGGGNGYRGGRGAPVTPTP